MLKGIRKTAIIFLAAILLCTASLYVYANADAVFSPIARVYDMYMERRAENDASAYVIRRYTEAEETAVPLTSGEDVPVEAVSYPLFEYTQLLEDIPGDAEQAVCVLGSGSEANIWVVEKLEGQWYNTAGPLYCRIGKEGLSDSKTQGDGKTPVGTTAIGAVYASSKPDGLKLEFIGLTSGDVWVTDGFSVSYNKHVCTAVNAGDFTKSTPMPGGEYAMYIDIGYNPKCIPAYGSGVLLRADRDLGAPTDGEISVSPDNLKRIALLLDGEKKPAAVIARAGDVGWRIEKAMSGSFVFLSDIAPEIKEDSKYAGSDNFMGRPIDGYIGNRVVVSREVGTALKAVNDSLKEKGLGLLVYDGYRPGRAEADIFAWINREGDPGMKEEHYPTLDKEDLPGIYLAKNSRHTRGIAVDLTLYDLATGNALEMGTIFDFFSPVSWYKSDSVTPHQLNCRRILREAMIAGGFSPYESEWWHFNFLSGKSNVVYDFVIPQ
ncbi:MAG: hypothetical protein LBL09_05330 [Oscillospiraceae bacterium]|jgi:D-alanyl-D-alanine dipeptidase|nr:hypothetical protein [Oscillospiraceae bacterium]